VATGVGQNADKTSICLTDMLFQLNPQLHKKECADADKCKYGHIVLQECSKSAVLATTEASMLTKRQKVKLLAAIRAAPKSKFGK
jgi:hypothetical protein